MLYLSLKWNKTPRDFSLNQPTGPIQSLSCVVCVYLCLCHHRNPASQWTGHFWLKSISLTLTYLYTFSCLFQFQWFFKSWNFFWEVFVSLQISLPDTWHLSVSVPIWYRCYYPHMSRGSMSPNLRDFFWMKMRLLNFFVIFILWFIF